MRRAAPPWSVVALAGGIGACAGEPSQVRVPRGPVAPVEAPPASSAPARWDYHPPLPESAAAAVKLGDGRCVATAEHGQRWTVTPVLASAHRAEPSAVPPAQPAAPAPAPAGPGLRCSGRAEASRFLAPEDLVGVVRRAGGWLFVGDSGSLYEAVDPLGPFGRISLAPEPPARVAGADSLVLAAMNDGRLMRWEESSGWRPSPPPGPGVRVLDVAVASGGRALALAFPEALFSSEDGAKTWAPVAAGPFGAQRVGLTAAGELAAQGYADSLVWVPGRDPAFVHAPEPVVLGGPLAELASGRAASSSAVTENRAVIDGDRYYEALRPDTEGNPWLLARGRIDGRLETVPIEKSDACGSVRLGARSRRLVLVCVRALAGSEIEAEVRRSGDEGTTWGSPIALATADTDQVSVAVAPDGSALVTGVCRTSDAAGACKPTAPLLVPADPGAPTAQVAASELEGLATLPAFSPDGRSAYFIGRRGKEERRALFVSHDAGRTFVMRPFEVPRERRQRAADPDEGESAPAADPLDDLDASEPSALHVGEDGAVGLVVARTQGPWYVVCDEDGHVVSASPPPANDAPIAGYGRHAVAYAASTDREHGLSFWESSDGGATWEEQPSPPALAREYGSGSGALAPTCGALGCLFGDTVSRVGWGGAPEPSPELAPPVAPDPASSPALLTPIVCELARTSAWTRVDHVQTRSDIPRLPDVGTVLRGRSIWSVATRDPRTGALDAVTAMRPESGDGDARVGTRSLFGPGGGHLATHLAHQAEGYGAIRLAIPLDAKGALNGRAHIRDVELAWENWMDGTSGRVRIPDAGLFEGRDVTLVAPLAGGLGDVPDAFVSVSAHGMFVRRHRTPQGDEPTYVADVSGKVSHVRFPAWPAPAFGVQGNTQSDAVFAESQPLPVGLFGPGDLSSVYLVGHRTAARAGSPGSPDWEVAATSLGPARAESEARGEGLAVLTGWSYKGKTTGVDTLVADPTRARGWAYFQAFHADGTFGPAEPLPTLTDLGDRPRPCTAADRASTPRFAALFASGSHVLFAGTRHPVLVSEAPVKDRISDTSVLLTADAVVHGSPAAPCVAGWVATKVGAEPGGHVAMSAVVTGDLKQSWLFREVLVDEEPAADAEPSRRPPPVARPARGRAPRPVRRPAQTPASEAFEYRPMACHFDPAARLPESVWAEPGTTKVER